jgi:hypothetical protein
LRSRIIAQSTVLLFATNMLFADFQYTETTKVTGGSLMATMKVATAFSKQARQINEPVTSSVYVSGNRMARVTPDHTEIVDLDRQTVTHVDHLKKQFYTITFQQMKEQAEAAAREAAMRQADQPAPAPQAQPQQPSTMDWKFDVQVRKTGAQKQLSGLDTSESILSLTAQATDNTSGQSGALSLTSDLWLTPEIPGYDEVRDFNLRYARKLGDVYGSIAAPMAASMRSQMKPGSAQGLGQMADQISKLKGVPIYTVMRMGSTNDGKPLPAASEAPLPDDQSAELPSKGEMAKQGANSAANNAIASKLGGFGGMLGGLGHKKKDNPPAAANDVSAQTQPTSVVLMETTSEMSGFSRAPIDASHFRPPAGYQEVSIPQPAR